MLKHGDNVARILFARYDYTTCMFTICYYRTDFTTKCPYLKATDVAPRGAEAKDATTSNITNITQKPSVQRKVQHTSLIGPTTNKTMSSSRYLRSPHQNGQLLSRKHHCLTKQTH